MEFEWDEAKNRSNIRKHGVGFERAKTISYGPTKVLKEEITIDGEVRELTIGILDGLITLAVVNTDRNGKIRIISARKATRYEQKTFEASLRS
jgi:uncharacterized DUF497 family protein